MMSDIESPESLVESWVVASGTLDAVCEGDATATNATTDSSIAALKAIMLGARRRVSLAAAL